MEDVVVPGWCCGRVPLYHPVFLAGIGEIPVFGRNGRRVDNNLHIGITRHIGCCIEIYRVLRKHYEKWMNGLKNYTLINRWTPVSVIS